MYSDEIARRRNVALRFQDVSILMCNNIFCLFVLISFLSALMFVDASLRFGETFEGDRWTKLAPKRVFFYCELYSIMCVKILYDEIHSLDFLLN